MRSSLFAPFDSLFAPPPQAQRVAFLARQPFAHRGLHDRAAPENSRAAFAAAIKAGHGIELDVRAARDGEAFVFHDDRLDRLTLASGRFEHFTADELERVPLRGSRETIPRFGDVVTLIGGQVPLLVEVKCRSTQVGVLCLGIRRALEGYGGDVAVMSFNPAVCRWFRIHAPRIVRGLVVSEQQGQRSRLRRALDRRLALWMAQPDFLACDIRDLPSRFAGQQQRRGLKLLIWTVRSAAEEALAFRHADEIIYEKPVALS